MPELNFPEPKGIVENIEAFFTAVNIYESFNVAILVFHLVVCVSVIATRKMNKVQMGIFFALLGMCTMLERANNWLSEHWRDYTSQNYFDKSGFFICVMIGFPMLCNCILIMILSFMNTIGTLVKLARARIQEKAKEKKDN